ncbi:MAG: DUF4380 domain-containing protein [Propioniciclava sp.]
MSDDLVVVDTGALRLVFWPGCGGRLLGIEVSGVEFLWRNPDYVGPDAVVKPKRTWAPLDGTMGSWANVGGSKTWPAPQGWSGPDEWPGPPDAVLDSGVWDCAVTAAPDTTVTLTSPADPRSGLRVTRTFEVPRLGTAFTQTNTFTNTSDTRVRWSIWEVCQVDTDGPARPAEIAVSVADREPPLTMVQAVGEVPQGTVADGVRTIQVTDVVGKLGLTNATGLLCLERGDGAAISMRFDPDPAASYPDDGCQAELWFQCPVEEPLAELGGLHPQVRLVELEVLGPLVTLEPGESTSLRIDWEVTPPR